MFVHPLCAVIPLAVVVTQTVVEGPPPQDPGLIPYVPAVAFLILAPIVWWIWRHVAED